MSERETRRLLQDIDGEEKSPEEFEIEMKAWFDAVLVSDYIGMFRDGYKLPTTIYGDPYPIRLDALRDCRYSDRLAELYRQLVGDGLQAIQIAKPKLDELFPCPASQALPERTGLFASSDQDSLRKAYLSKFFEMMYGWGHRDILVIGAKGYLDQVPDQLSIFSYCAPDATKSFITQDGYFGMGYSVAPDFERPLSQRGGKSGYLRAVSPYDTQYFEGLTSQISFLVEHVDRFKFDSTDLLGYRPKDMSEAGIAETWDGWKSRS